jgi:hypothetical protein
LGSGNSTDVELIVATLTVGAVGILQARLRARNQAITIDTRVAGWAISVLQTSNFLLGLADVKIGVAYRILRAVLGRTARHMSDELALRTRGATLPDGAIIVDLTLGEGNLTITLSTTDFAGRTLSIPGAFNGRGNADIRRGTHQTHTAVCFSRARCGSPSHTHACADVADLA